MKFIKTIETLNERAKRKGIATLNRTQPDGYITYSMIKREVYKIEHENNTARLFHYGTLTAEINTITKEVKTLYGRSTSDADSVGTFLKVNGIEGYIFGYKPVNGGFYTLYNGKKI